MIEDEMDLLEIALADAIAAKDWVQVIFLANKLIDCERTLAADMQHEQDRFSDEEEAEYLAEYNAGVAEEQYLANAETPEEFAFRTGF